jgi:histone-lysine N-methyltransferase SETD2
MDREFALMNAIQLMLPNAKHLLCMWHIQMAIVKNCKSLFEEVILFAKFTQAWTILSYSTLEETF